MFNRRRRKTNEERLFEAIGRTNLTQQNINEVIELISMNVNLNHQAAEGLTPLMEAARFGHTAIVNLFLLNGASVNQLSEMGNTALMFAAAFGKLDVVRTLIQEGANPALRNSNNLSAFDLATENDHPAVSAYLRTVGSPQRNVAPVQPVAQPAAQAPAPTVAPLLVHFQQQVQQVQQEQFFFEIPAANNSNEDEMISRTSTNDPAYPVTLPPLEQDDRFAEFYMKF